MLGVIPTFGSRPDRTRGQNGCNHDFTHRPAEALRSSYTGAFNAIGVHAPKGRSSLRLSRDWNYSFPERTRTAR